MNVELITENNKIIYYPIIEDEITWTTERIGSPGELSFSFFQDDLVNVQEGNPVRLRVDNTNVFYGFVFSKKRSKEKSITVKAYDQLRYLKNKDTYVYENKTASDLVKMLADDFYLQTGIIENTSFYIESRIEENTSLFDIIYNALDLELTNKRNMYILYDDFGKITLKNLSSMKLDLIIDEETGENFDYTSSIDEKTYNQIKLTYDNEDAGQREVYIAKDSNHINEWGVLQYFDTLQKGENGQAKVDALLSLYNAKTKNLKISDAFGDLRVRAGSMVILILNLGDIKLQNYMLVEKCVHKFTNNQHSMDLNLRGGEFVG